MGLQKSIERIFQRTVELDLDLISQSASATHGGVHTTPQQSCECACGIVANVASDTRRVDEQLFRVKQIVFTPIKNFYKEVLQERLEERVGVQSSSHHIDALRSIELEALKPQGDEKPKFENEKVSLVTLLAEHYRDEGPSVTIFPRHPQQNGPMIISVGSVDYVQRLLIDQGEVESLVEKKTLHLPVMEALERWPEVIVLQKNGEQQGPEGEYMRADLAMAKTPRGKRWKAAEAKRRAALAVKDRELGKHALDEIKGSDAMTKPQRDQITRISGRNQRMTPYISHLHQENQDEVTKQTQDRMERLKEPKS